MSRTTTTGRLQVADGAGVVRVEQSYDTGPDDLWSALTEPDRLARWYGQVSGELRLGGQFTVRIDGPDIDGIGHVVECVPASFLRVRTRETDESARRGGGVPFDQTIEATLTPKGDQTVLVMTISGLPLDKIAAYGVGWQLHAESLERHLAGRSGPDVATRWGELQGEYERLAAQL